MAGSLIKIDEVIVSGAVSTVTLGAADWDNSYNVYMVQYSQLETDSSSANTIAARFTKASDNSVDDSSNYDYAYKTLKSYASPSADSDTNDDRFFLSTINTANSTQDNGILYLFNFQSHLH